MIKTITSSEAAVAQMIPGEVVVPKAAPPEAWPSGTASALEPFHRM